MDIDNLTVYTDAETMPLAKSKPNYKTIVSKVAPKLLIAR